MGERNEVLDAQAEAVLDLIRAAVVRLVRDGGASPQLVALAAARVAGELGASIAAADGVALEQVARERAGFVDRAAREHYGLVGPGGPGAAPARARPSRGGAGSRPRRQPARE
jgi:hypothetical protein